MLDIVASALIRRLSKWEGVHGEMLLACLWGVFEMG